MAESSVKIPHVISKPKVGAEYFLRFSLHAKQSMKLWAKKGFEVATTQFKIGDELWSANIALSSPVDKSPLTLTQNDTEINVKGNNFSVVLDKVSGTFTQIEQGHTNLLTANGGPRLHLWRAPHRNE